MLYQNSTIPAEAFPDVGKWFADQARKQNAAAFMPLDAYRRGNDVWVHVDLPGVGTDSIDMSVERSVLTITAERARPRSEGDSVYLAERHQGRFRRQVMLGDGLDDSNIEADYHDGVLTLRIPVAEKAQPRKISVRSGRGAIDASAEDITAAESTTAA